MTNISHLPTEVLTEYIFPLLEDEIFTLSLVCTAWQTLTQTKCNLKKVAQIKNCTPITCNKLYFNLNDKGRIKDMVVKFLGLIANLGREELQEDALASCIVINRLKFEIFEIIADAPQSEKKFFQEMVCESKRLDIRAESIVMQKLFERGVKLFKQNHDHFFNDQFYDKLQHVKTIEETYSNENLTTGEKISLFLSDARFYQRQVILLGNSQRKSRLSRRLYKDIFTEELNNCLEKLCVNKLFLDFLKSHTY